MLAGNMNAYKGSEFSAGGIIITYLIWVEGDIRQAGDVIDRCLGHPCPTPQDLLDARGAGAAGHARHLV